MQPTDLPSLNHLRAVAAGSAPFHVGILIGPGFVPMDMVGIQTVLGLMPGVEIHLLWKSHELVEGFPNWWTRPTTTFAECPARLDVLAIPMLAPEVQNDPEVIAFAADKAATAGHVIGICNGVLVLGAAGVLKDRRVTASHNALPILHQLGVKEVIPAGHGVAVDGNLYTAGPGVGSFEAAFMVVEAVFGRQAAQLAEVIIEYDPHPLYGMGVPAKADPELVAQFEAIMEPLVVDYRKGSVTSFETIEP
ncbi:DJ-1/PfpI family protein [Novosphingobium terrae]|uniref:DJ-1/PfpI family protein n=1 Tax=Novosphingobium terrae TaxID=2726189 RepID=UPI0019821EB9|nr:DJ-1/PfpI family protein [Novosphingobium terrae]